jgi:hypothetical protein
MTLNAAHDVRQHSCYVRVRERRTSVLPKRYPRRAMGSTTGITLFVRWQN